MEELGMQLLSEESGNEVLEDARLDYFPILLQS